MSIIPRCPICARDLDVVGRDHCDSPTCIWTRCSCGTVVSQSGLWISPAANDLA